MATNGNNARITISSLLLHDVVSEDFGLKTSMIDVTTKTSAGNKEVITGLREQTLSCEMLHTKKPSGGTSIYVSDLVDMYSMGTLVAWTYSASATPGDIKFSGNAYVSDIAIKAAANDKVSVSITLAPTGAVIIGTV